MALTTTEKILAPEVVEELAEVERQLQRWNIEAVGLVRSIETLAMALRTDASRIHFKGDLIVLDDPKSPHQELGAVNLASIRNFVFNVKMLQAQRKQFQAQVEQARQSVCHKNRPQFIAASIRCK